MFLIFEMQIECEPYSTKDQNIWRKKCLKFVDAMEIEPWEDLYEDNNDWYSVFVTRARRMFETCFP